MVEELCEHCSPVSDVRSEYEEWVQNGYEKAAEIIHNINTKDNSERQ